MCRMFVVLFLYLGVYLVGFFFVFNVDYMFYFGLEIDRRMGEVCFIVVDKRCILNKIIFVGFYNVSFFDEFLVEVQNRSENLYGVVVEEVFDILGCKGFVIVVKGNDELYDDGNNSIVWLEVVVVWYFFLVNFLSFVSMVVEDEGDVYDYEVNKGVSSDEFDELDNDFSGGVVNLQEGQEGEEYDDGEVVDWDIVGCVFVEEVRSLIFEGEIVQ